MNGQTNNTSLTPNTPINTDKIEWTCVSWFNKISDSVANKTCRFLGITVAALASVFTFIPSLAADLGYATKRLYDRKINTPPTPIQNLMPSNDSELPSVREISPSDPDYAGYVQDFLTGDMPDDDSDYTFYTDMSISSRTESFKSSL